MMKSAKSSLKATSPAPSPAAALPWFPSPCDQACRVSHEVIPATDITVGILTCWSCLARASFDQSPKSTTRIWAFFLDPKSWCKFLAQKKALVVTSHAFWGQHLGF